MDNSLVGSGLCGQLVSWVRSLWTSSLVGAGLCGQSVKLKTVSVTRLFWLPMLQKLSEAFGEPRVDTVHKLQRIIFNLSTIFCADLYSQDFIDVGSHFGAIFGPDKSDPSRQRLVTAVTFLRNGVAQALSRGDGSHRS